MYSMNNLFSNGSTSLIEVSIVICIVIVGGWADGGVNLWFNYDWLIRRLIPSMSAMSGTNDINKYDICLID